ncbi:PEP-CTERM sorting domain-containing protein [Lacipirellula parvula]|uniref:Ice-binding protein C-terminal domain-containing protein n=1 Tax=Lacipirellula parvula TaxID=2650471 RepID=A0A5K7X804_9BACT|nr:PEP-CTERM sorting domain-containing protein [Lacipirellula parvula]BBO32002.1 hypothetical protein PLANPX_1614 [Lacipirellula parvula]
MTRLLGWLLACGGMLAVVLAGPATAQTVSTEHYRFLPKLSVLNQHGGFGGFDVDHRVMGTFDFEVEIGPTDVWPTEYVAKFSDVNAWASHPILAYVLPLNQTLNLEGLVGRKVPVRAPIDIYRFDGTTGDGSSVELYAAQIGPWLHLKATTTAPPNSADFFEYELKAVARRTPFADFDGNSSVDNADLATWASRFGLKASAGDPLAHGDANGDGVTDGADFLAWQRQAGEVVPTAESLDALVTAALATANGASQSSMAAVPEPATLSLLGVALIAAFRLRPRSLSDR